MKEELVSARRHPAALASIVIASVAVTALALVTIAYLVGWIPMRGAGPAPGAMATPGQQVTGSMQEGGVVLLPGETLVAPADTPKPAPASPAPLPAPAAPQPTTPQYAKPAPKKAPPPIYTQPPAPASSTSYATVLPSRAAPSKPSYNREATAPATSFERSTRNICVNCGVIASIGSAGGDWEVRVRFDDGSTETLRYPDRPRLRIGERVHLEDGRLIPE
jgi:hypothetical protein